MNCPTPESDQTPSRGDRPVAVPAHDLPQRHTTEAGHFVQSLTLSLSRLVHHHQLIRSVLPLNPQSDEKLTNKATKYSRDGYNMYHPMVSTVGISGVSCGEVKWTGGENKAVTHGTPSRYSSSTTTHLIEITARPLLAIAWTRQLE